jgi:hypothetical protein
MTTRVIDEELTDLLVEQKDNLFKLINGGGQEGLIVAKGALNLLLPLWTANGYRYKYDEMMRIVFEREASRDD